MKSSSGVSPREGRLNGQTLEKDGSTWTSKAGGLRTGAPPEVTSRPHASPLWLSAFSSGGSSPHAGVAAPRGCCRPQPERGSFCPHCPFANSAEGHRLAAGGDRWRRGQWAGPRRSLRLRLHLPVGVGGQCLEEDNRRQAREKPWMDPKVHRPPQKPPPHTDMPLSPPLRLPPPSFSPSLSLLLSPPSSPPISVSLPSSPIPHSRLGAPQLLEICCHSVLHSQLCFPLDFEAFTHLPHFCSAVTFKVPMVPCAQS